MALLSDVTGIGNIGLAGIPTVILGTSVTVGGTLAVTGAATFSSTGAFTGSVSVGDANQTISAAGTTALQLSAAAAAGEIHLRTAGSNRACLTNAGVFKVGPTADSLPNYGWIEAIADGTVYTPGFFRSTGVGDVSNAVIELVKQDATNTTSAILMRFNVDEGVTGQGAITGNGANQAAFATFSDRTLKENITDLPSQYAAIKSLRPVEFDYIASEGGGHQIGFIAQEMQEVYPCCVGTREDGKLTVGGWSKTESRLVSVIQELMAKVEALEDNAI